MLLLPGDLLKLLLRQFERISAARVVEAAAYYAILVCRNDGSTRVRRCLLHQVHGMLNTICYGCALGRDGEALAVHALLLVFAPWIVRSRVNDLICNFVLEAERRLLPARILLVQSRILMTRSKCLLGYVFLLNLKYGVVRECSFTRQIQTG